MGTLRDATHISDQPKATLMRRFAVLVLFCTLPIRAQSNMGELRLKVTDPSGLGVKTNVQIVSQANQYRNTLMTDDQGRLEVQRLPYGIYQVNVGEAGFANASEAVDPLANSG